MPEYMTCFACEREPTQQCSRCGRPYCDEHGEELCDICMSPASGVPSFTLYRGTLFALLLGVILAVWLFIQPNDSETEAVRPIVVTPTLGAARGLTTPTLPGSQPASNTTPGANPTPPAGAGTPLATRPAGTAGTTPAATTPSSAGGTTEYTVVAGDSLTAICEKARPASMTIPDCVERIQALNNLSNAASISPGDKLKVPR